MMVKDWIDYYKGLTQTQRDILIMSWKNLEADPMTKKHYLADTSSHIYAIESAERELSKPEE